MEWEESPGIRSPGIVYGEMEIRLDMTGVGSMILILLLLAYGIQSKWWEEIQGVYFSIEDERSIFIQASTH